MSRVNNKDDYLIRMVDNIITQKDLTLIIFFRGWWCPACRTHLSQVETIKDKLDKKNVGIIGITSQSEKNGNILKRLAEKDVNITFPIISNPNNFLAKYFLPKHSQYTLPTPTQLNSNIYDGENFIPYEGQQPALIFVDKQGALKFCWSMKNDLPPGTGYTKDTYTRGTVGDPWIRVTPASILQLVEDIVCNTETELLQADTVDLFPKKSS